MTSKTEPLPERVTAFLFEGIHGDEIDLTQSGRIKLVVEAHLVVDGHDYPVRRLTSATWPPRESLATRIAEYVTTWCERIGDTPSNP